MAYGNDLKVTIGTGSKVTMAAATLLNLKPTYPKHASSLKDLEITL